MNRGAVIISAGHGGGGCPAFHYRGDTPIVVDSVDHPANHPAELMHFVCQEA